MAFTSDVFGNVPLKDAEIAVQYWVELLAKDMGNTEYGWSRVFPDASSLFTAAGEQTFDILAMPPVEYLQQQERELYEPVLASTLMGNCMTRFLLLVHRDSTITELRQLRGKTLILQSYGCGRAHEMWLDLQLKTAGEPRVREFFRRLTVEKEASKCALPVFFRQADACLMLNGSFDVLSEMNPQLKKQLVTLKQSEEFLGGFVLFPKQMPPARKQQLRDICLRMSTYPRGRQVFTLFRIESLISFPPGALESLRSLLLRHMAEFKP